MDFFRWMVENWELGDPLKPPLSHLNPMGRPSPIGFPGIENIFKQGSPMIGAFVILALLAVAYRKTRLRKRQTPDCP
ncbi:MAG: hypothetical protein AAGE61_17455 [Pseudomonadota bacterium]